MPARFGIRMTAFFLIFLARLSFASQPEPLASPQVTLRQIAQQRVVAAQALQTSQAQEQKLAQIEQQLNGEAQQPGQVANSTQLKNQLDHQAQLLAQLQRQKDQAAQEQVSDYLNTQDQIIATQVDSRQELKQLQVQIDLQQQSVGQLAQTIQAQQATHIESPILEDAINQYQQQKQRLDQLESLKENLAVQAAQTQMAGDFNQNQSQNNAKANSENLQSQYAEAERSYQQLEESYQLALAKDETSRKQASDLDDRYEIEKQKQIALDDTSARESKKLDQMIKDFSRH